LTFILAAPGGADNANGRAVPDIFLRTPQGPSQRISLSSDAALAPLAAAVQAGPVLVSLRDWALLDGLDESITRSLLCLLSAPGVTVVGPDGQTPLPAPPPELQRLMPRAALPEIRVRVDELRVNDEAIVALAARGGLYQRGEALVELRKPPERPRGIQRPPASVRAVPTPNARLRELLADSAAFLNWNVKQEAWVPASVPSTVVEAVAARGRWDGVPVLEGIVQSPQFLADGRLLTEPGYDDGSGLYLATDLRIEPMPEVPTIDDARRAAEELSEVIVDFPTDAPGRSIWLSLVLTGQSRYAIDGCVPMHFAQANTAGTGKGLFVDSAAALLTGIGFSRTSAPATDEEMRKLLLSAGLAGDPILLIDNIESGKPFGFASLDAWLTSRTYMDRVLKESRVTTVPTDMIMIGTGNGLMFRGDMPRRALVAILTSDMERPELRTGFAHPDLLGWVRDQRSRLVRAGLMILHAYHVAGRPRPMTLTPLGGFEEWSRLIRGALLWLGLADPVGHPAEGVDTEREALQALLLAWRAAQRQQRGMTVAEAIRAAHHDGRIVDPVSHSAIVGLVGSGGGGDLSTRAKKLGEYLSSARQRVVSGLHLERRPGPGNVASWLVVSAGDAPAGAATLAQERPHG
jgi:putative DNA primase/helicase